MDWTKADNARLDRIRRILDRMDALHPNMFRMSKGTRARYIALSQELVGGVWIRRKVKHKLPMPGTPDHHEMCGGM